MPYLTERQRTELHQALKEYLQTHGFTEAGEKFEAELSEKTEFVSGDTPIEKKWSLNLRLQHKCKELEDKVRQLEEELEELRDPDPQKRCAVIGLPVEPAKLTLEGHREVVNCVCLHPTFSVLLSCSDDASIRVWDYESGVHERTLRSHTSVINCVEFDPTGKLFASCSADLTIKLWEFPSADNIKTLQGHDHNVSCVRFLPAGDRLASCSRDGTVRVWDLQSGYCKQTLAEHEDWVRCIAISHDGALLASGSVDQTVRVWDVRTGRSVHVFREPEHVVDCLAFSGAKATETLPALVGGAPTPTPKADPGEPAGNGAVGDGRPVQAAAFLIAGCRDKAIRLWDAVGGVLICVLTGHDDWVKTVAFHPSGEYIISGSDDRSIRVWDVVQRRCKKKILDAHDHFVGTLVIHPTKPVLVTGSVDKNVRVWRCK